MSRVTFTEEELKNSKVGRNVSGLKLVVGNKKVRNARKVEYNGLKFDSGLELHMYKQLVNFKINFVFKPERYILQPTFKYHGDTVRLIWMQPDFFLPDHNTIVDTKGFSLDVAKIKYKVLKYMLSKTANPPKIVWLSTKAKVYDFIVELIADK